MYSEIFDFNTEKNLNIYNTSGVLAIVLQNLKLTCAQDDITNDWLEVPAKHKMIDLSKKKFNYM